LNLQKTLQAAKKMFQGDIFDFLS